VEITMEHAANDHRRSALSTRRHGALWFLVTDLIDTAAANDDVPQSIAESVALMKADAERIASGG
jgi:hypothetical protein